MKVKVMVLMMLLVMASLLWAGGGQSDGSAAPSASTGAFSYPIPGNKTLTINLDPIDMSAIPNWVGDDYFWTVIEKKTGVKLRRIGGTSGAVSVTESFTLLLASGDWPDIMVASWLTFPGGGPDKGLSEGYIIPLNDYMQKAPNFTRILKDNPGLSRDIRTDNGTLYVFPFARDSVSSQYAGAVIRKDWLDKLGLPLPVTLDDWYKTLTAFKQFCSAPLTFESRYFFMEEYFSSVLSSPFDVTYLFYVDNNTVKFGPLEKSYRDFITEMHKWYTEGLLDKDMPSINKATVAAKFANGNTGLVIQQRKEVVDAITANAGNPNYEVAALLTPVMKLGDERKFGHLQNNYTGGFSWGISSKCKDIETAIRYIDYFFSDEGRMLSCFGTEGVSYEIKNGKVQILESALNHPELSNPRMLFENYFGAPSNHAFLEIESARLVGEIPQMVEIKKIWADNNMKNYIYPPVTPTAAESEAIGLKWNNIDTYCQEMIIKFIIGTEPLSNYDRFLQNLKAYGVDEVLKSKQAAYDRYLKK
jgi:putative aldouronate transport system substrate-binding protein